MQFKPDTNSWHEIDEPDKIILDKAIYAEQSKNMEYDYSKDFCDKIVSDDVFFDRLDRAFEKALENYRSVLKRIGLEQNWTTIIKLYRDFQLSENCDAREGQKIEKTIVLQPVDPDHSEQILTLHLDVDLFYDLLIRKGSWNGAISGTYIMYEREPNIFMPNVPFSLNFLAVKE